MVEFKKKEWSWDDAIDGDFRTQLEKMRGQRWISCSEIQEIRASQGAFTNMCAHTGDGILYHVDASGTPLLYITDPDLNPVAKNPNAAAAIIRTGYFTPEQQDITAIMDSVEKADGLTTVIRMNALRLRELDENRSLLTFCLQDYRQQLNYEELKLVDAFHGKGRDLAQMMAHNTFITEYMHICLLNPNAVLRHAKNSPIACVASLERMDSHNNSEVDASSDNIQRTRSDHFELEWDNDSSSEAYMMSGAAYRERYYAVCVARRYVENASQKGK